MLLGRALILVFLLYFNDAQDAMQYNDNNFSLKMLEHETALVMFYAPWCGHCKKLKPEFNKASRELEKSEPPVTLVQVDCTKSGKKTCSYNKVSGYPTLKIFRFGVAEEYTGPRDAPGIVKYMRLLSGPSSKEFQNSDDLDKVLSGPVAVVIGFFKAGSHFIRPFLDVADKMRGKVQFGHTTDKDMLEKRAINDDEITIFRPRHLRNKFEEDGVKFSGNASVDEIRDFILNNSHGLVGHRTDTNRDDFKVPNVIVYFQVDYKRNMKGTNYWRNRILKVAQQYQHKLTFAMSHFDELNDIGKIPFKDKPVVFATNSDNEKYQMEDEFTVEAFQDFVQKFLDNKLEPYIKSEEIPETNDKPVKIAVGKTFKQLIIENEKDTLIVFHTPWCPHCKSLMPTYDSLAEDLKNEDLVIAKMDASNNYVPPLFKVTGYPTIYWLPKNSKDAPLQYESGRTKEDFIKYIAKHATEELKSYDRNGDLKQKDEL